MSILNSIFTLILVYGYPAIAASVFFTSAGVPLPGVAIVLVAGSLAATGNHNLILLFFLVTICSVAGDCLDYYLGKKVGIGIIEKLCKYSKFIKKSYTKTERYFAQWSGFSIFFSRWLTPPLAPTVSLLAGITEYPFRKFLIFDIAGEIISSLIFLGLGYAFSINSQYIWGSLNGVTGIGIGGAVGLALVIFGVRGVLRKK